MTRPAESTRRRPRLRLVMAPLFLFMFAGAGGSAMMDWTPRSMKSLYTSTTPLVIGHRGAAGLAPENTILAMDKARHAGAQGVEFDVMLTKDKQLVVFHDIKLEKRLNDKKGKVQQMTLAELQKLDLVPYFKMRNPNVKNIPAEFAKLTVPTLEQLFTYYKKYPKQLLNIELKSRDVTDKGLEKAVWALVQKFGFEKRVLVSSFNPFALYRFRKLAPQILRGLIYGPDTPIYIRNRWFAWLAQPDALHPESNMVNEAYMRWAKRKGYAVHPWTVNLGIELERLKKLKVGMVITDRPDRAKKIFSL